MNKASSWGAGPKITARFSMAVSLLVLATLAPVASAQSLWGEDEGALESVVVTQVEAPKVKNKADQFAADALTLLEKGKIDEASQKINAALQLEIRKSYYHLINGVIYHMQAKQGGQGSFELAEQGYKQAINFDHNNWLAYYYAGMLAAEQQQFIKARGLLAQALMLRKKDRGILNAFAYSAYMAGTPDLAAGAIHALENIGGINTHSELRNATLVMAAVGDQQAAEKYLQKLKMSSAHDFHEIEQRKEDWNDVYKQ